MRTRLTAAAAVAAAVAALVLPATAHAAATKTAVPSTAARWMVHSGPYPDLGDCQFMARYYGYNSKNSYCNQITLGRWYLIVWK